MLKQLAVAVATLALASPALSEVMEMPETDATEAPVPVNVPTRGTTMENVLATHGEPVSRTGPIGDPPITRWDYGSFIVVFEHDLVLNSVIPAKPPTIYHQDELQAASSP